MQTNTDFDAEDTLQKIRRYHSSIGNKYSETPINLDTLNEFQYDMEEEIIEEQLAITFIALLYYEYSMTRWKPISKRDARIFLDVVSGVSMSELGSKYNVPGTRIKQIYLKVLWALRNVAPYLTEAESAFNRL